MAGKVWLLLGALAAWAVLAAPGIAAERTIYGHVSFIDGDARVVRGDGGEEPAVVNLPVAPGDTLVTAAGRCELQFDNGTVVRLDKDSRLRVATVLAPSLTSSWEITTLDLLRGQLYALPQSYNREMFQVVTPNAAVLLKSRTAAFIRLDDDGSTSLFSDGGKFEVLYGADPGSLKKAKVRSGRPLAVDASHALSERVARKSIEFTAWNEYVDRHFRELHFGISKVPANLTKFKNKALLYWAEKWSSRFGEWIYDELFGYVWRPADERFAFLQRPFFHADFVRINGKLFLVPQEQWGWIPAHMGTWVWLKRGWTWIPGDWFHPGIVDFQGTYAFPTFYYYCHMFDSNIFPWPPSRPAVETDRPDLPPRRPKPSPLPDPVIGLVKKVVKAFGSDAERRQAIERVVPAIDGGKLVPAPLPAVSRPAGTGPVEGQDQAGGAGEVKIARDWNPDSRWAARNHFSIRYSSSQNAVVCPELKVSSDRLEGVERMRFRESAAGRSSGTFSGSSGPGQAGDASGASSEGDGTAAPDQGSSNTGEHAQDDGKG